MGIDPTTFEAMKIRLEWNRRKKNRQPLQDDAVEDEVSELHEPILKWCRENHVAFIYSRSDKKATINKGAPDFTICWKGKVIFIECKSKTGKFRPEQIAWRLGAESAGIPVHAVRSMGEFYETLFPSRNV